MTDDDRTPEVTAFYEGARWLGVTADDRPSWLAARQSVVGASEVAAILGESKWEDAFNIFIQKTSPPVDEELTIRDPRVWGLAHERPNAEIAAKYLKWPRLRWGGALLASREWPWLATTLDAEIIREEGGPWEVYEGKSSKYEDGWDEDEQMVPLAYLLQANSQLMVTKAPAAFLFGVIGGSNPKQIVVRPRESFWPVIAAATRAFMDLVERAEPPPVTSKSGRGLEKLFPEAQAGKRVMLPKQALEWTADYKELLEREKTIKEAKAEIQNKVKLLIGDAEYGELPEDVGGVGRWEWTARESYEVPAYQVKRSRPLFMRKGKDDRFVAPPVDIKRLLEMSVTEHQAAAERPVLELAPAPGEQASLDFAARSLEKGPAVQRLLNQAAAPKKRFGRKRR